VVRIHAVGTAEVQVGRSRIRPDSVVLFALALYLGLTAGERIARTRLLDLFWPGVPDVSRRHALRQLLYRLRRSGFALALDGDELLLEPANVESDVTALLDARWPDEAPVEAIVAAASVLPGYTPPMPEHYRDWLDALRARISAQHRRAVLRQIACARREGRWRDVDEWASRCLEADPLNEEATLARAEALAMSGSKARALQLLDDYLWELGERAKVIGLPAKVLRRRISDSGEERAASRAASVPLLGRSAETASLNQMLAATLQGRGAGVLVVGAPGIGKTALAQEFLASAEIGGWKSAVTRLQPSDVQRPLSVFVDLFSVLLRMPGALGAAPDSLTQLQRLTAHGVEDSSPTPKSQEAEAVQERIRTSAVDLLGALSDEGPLVILLEDLHWIDDESVRLLQHLMGRTRELPVFWLLTARPEAKHAALRASLPEEFVPGIRLEPLTPDDGAALFRASAEQAASLDQSVVHSIADGLTGGNPLFIREVARHFTETGSAASLPGTLRALIRDRVARLQPMAQHVLHTCAVLGRYSTVPRVAGVLEIGTAGLLACIEELDALGILGAGKDADALALHDLWQEELMSSLRPASRQLIHHRCGTVLEAESRQTRAAAMVWEAARHLKAGGAHARALSVLEECAQHLLDNGLPVDAAKTYELAFDAATTDEERLRVLSGRISALHYAADWEQIAHVIGPAIVLQDRCVPGKNGHSDLELLQTETLWRTEANAVASFERALACASDVQASSAHRARAAVLAAVNASNLALLVQLKHLYDVVGALPREEVTERSDVLTVETIYHTEVGSLDSAMIAAEERIAFEHETGSVRGLARALRHSSYPLRCLGEFDEAFARTKRALDLAEEHQLVGEAAHALDSLVTICLEREDPESARSWLPRAEAWAKRVGATGTQNSQTANKAIIALAAGDLETASSLIPDDVERYSRNPQVRQRIKLLSILARLFAGTRQLSRLETTLAPLRSALALTLTMGRQDYVVASYAVGAEATSGWEEASKYVQAYVSTARRDRSPVAQELVPFLKK